MAPSADQLASFAWWLERTPSRKHRRGRERRRSAGQRTLLLSSERSAATVEGILTAVVEFVRFAAFRGWCGRDVASRLSVRTELAFSPPGWDRGGRAGRPVVERRLVRRRRAELPAETLSAGQVSVLANECLNIRDRFIVEALYATGLRVAELCGLHLTDLHFLPSAAHLGCQVAGAHLHVVRRPNNDNGALAKSARPQVVPVTRSLVACHDAYRFERDAVAEAAESDYLFVNLWREPRGRALSPDVVERLFVRLSARVQGAAPHAAPQFRLRGGPGDERPRIGEGTSGPCLGRLDQRHLHARWDHMRAAVDAHARALVCGYSVA